MLNHHVLLVDGFQQSGGQRLEVRDWLRSHRQTAAVLFRQQQLLHYNHKRTISDGWAQMYNRNDRSFLTLSGRENPGQCTTVGFTTDGGVLPALQGALKYVMYNRVKEHKKIHLCYWWVFKKKIFTLYLVRLVLSRLASCCSWLSRSCKYLQEAVRFKTLI